ncbi:AtpZ/AtpI family protein [Candidatus Stoquefichus sp. SB1]|jgi:F0F1-type ATP synthase assembly protein I|uniref:AtpZ/AtpI family protein n=1 Tax=Candidatus Stoquefichus sp. SB1 TaxID=1658109 RepID=UPI00067ECE61|nr:AtpZ/AtpI family protein [Candidatus Stoquefichus sp. SB1]
MLKDLLFALELGIKVIGTFILCTFLGVKLDAYFGCQPIILLICLLLAFIYVIKLLLGVGRHE